MDLNLLLALDALLEEGSVTAAAERLHTSPPAMSRTLGRLRRTLDDPLLVRAGRRLVPTPRALELKDPVHAFVAEARSLLAPRGVLDHQTLTRSFSIVANDMLVLGIAARLLDAVRAEAPQVTLRFLPESLEGTDAFREGRADLEVGVIDHADRESVVEPVTGARFVGVARPDHPLVTGRVTLRKYVAAEHVSVSRRGRAHGPVDALLAEQGLSRHVAAVVPTLGAALILVRDAGLVGLGPSPIGSDVAGILGLQTFPVPLDLPDVEVAMAWHPRHDADPAHQWLRAKVRDVVTHAAAAT